MLPHYMPLLKSVKIVFTLNGFLLTIKYVHGSSWGAFDANITFETHSPARMVSAWSGDSSSDEALRERENYRSAIEAEWNLFRVILSRIGQWRRITRTNPNVNYIRSLGIFELLRICRSSRSDDLTHLTALDIDSFDLVGIDRGGYHLTGLVRPEFKRLGLAISSRDEEYRNRGQDTSKTGFFSRIRITYPMLEELDLAPKLFSWNTVTWPSQYDFWPILDLGHLKVLKIAVDFAGIDDSANWTADSRLQPDVKQSEGGGPEHLYIYIDFERYANWRYGVIQTPGSDPDPELIVRWIMQVVPRNSYVGVRDFEGPESKWLLQTREELYQARRKR